MMMALFTAKFHVKKKQLSEGIARDVLRSLVLNLILSRCIRQAFLRSLLISSASQRHDAEMQHPEPINMQHTHMVIFPSSMLTTMDKKRKKNGKNYSRTIGITTIVPSNFHSKQSSSQVTKSLQSNYINKSFVVRFHCINLINLRI